VVLFPSGARDILFYVASKPCILFGWCWRGTDYSCTWGKEAGVWSWSLTSL